MSHGRKMSKMGALHPRILPAVELSGLAALVGASYDTIDKRQKTVVCLFRKVAPRDKFISSACR